MVLVWCGFMFQPIPRSRFTSIIMTFEPICCRNQTTGYFKHLVKALCVKDNYRRLKQGIYFGRVSKSAQPKWRQTGPFQANV